MSGPAERDTPAAAAAGLFVHIKKTAGISIRESLEESEAVVCDYGAGGPKTSPVIKQYKYVRYEYSTYRRTGTRLLYE